MASALLIAALCLVIYCLANLLRPFVSLYGNLRRARTVGLPIKVLPVPQGLFSFFALQILRRLHLVRPGTTLHKMLNMGRPDGYELHKEMGDVFLTVNPTGVGLVVADPKVVTYVNGRRSEFPKPPNTGAIINIYGRNVINADGDIWRFHRRVTGPVFSERINSAVWDEGRRQVEFMMRFWDPSSSAPSVRVNALNDDTLRLGLHVITGAAYGCPLEWDESPPSTKPQHLSYRGSVEQLTAHLMPLFLTPRWLLRLAPCNTTWGRAWSAYQAFGGYMEGMLDREQRLRLGYEDGKEDVENLLTALIRAEQEVDEKEGRKMSREEVMGNAFIFLFAGHETTANTLHYALLLLALHQEVQQQVLDEIDAVYERAASEGRSELDYDVDYARAIWIMAVMSETLRVYTPTGMVNKWTVSDQPITFQGRTYVIPRSTRIAINGTGVHSNPKVWGEDASVWRPSRWILDASTIAETETDCCTSDLSPTPKTMLLSRSTLNQDAKLAFNKAVLRSKNSLLTPPPTPNVAPAAHMQTAPSSDVSTPQSPDASFTPPISSHMRSDSSSSATTAQTPGVLKPPKGAFLPFSEGARACSGKKFATVEFVSVLFVLLKTYRVELVGEGEGWSEDRVRNVLAGRKAGALTLQPPEAIPVTFVRR